MDYEKAYKDALERAKISLDDKTISNIAIAYIKDIFPELAESEDERIRKSIIAIINNYVDNSNTFKPKMLAWLEKQGQSTFDKCRQEGDRIVENPDGTHFNISQLKRVAKVEPKFHEGDWIINNDSGDVFKVIEAKVDEYCLWPINAEIMGYLRITDVDTDYHLWTIKDAKNGDILTSSHSQPFIYNGNYNSFNVGAHGGIDCMGSVFLTCVSDDNWTSNKGIYPATKGQRDILFEKMKEAGYKWDKEKKELSSLKVH